MSANHFTVDTNILIYALEQRDPAKHKIALHAMNLLRGEGGVVLLQALGELCNATARKRPELRPAAERYVTSALEAFKVITARPEDLADALGAQQGHGIPFWDAMLWATARRSGCRTILSEDFQDGRILGGVRFRNPFRMSLDELSLLVGSS